MEEFIFAGPIPAHAPCTTSASQPNQGIITFYRWYLQNLPRITRNMSREERNREDLLPPLNLSWKELSQYVALIRRNFPGLDTIKVAIAPPSRASQRSGSSAIQDPSRGASRNSRSSMPAPRYQL